MLLCATQSIHAWACSNTRGMYTSVADHVEGMTACCVISTHASATSSTATVTALSMLANISHQNAKLQLPTGRQSVRYIDLQTDRHTDRRHTCCGLQANATWHYHHLLFFQLVQDLICILDASTQLEPGKHAGLRLLPLSQTCQVLLCNRPVCQNAQS